MAGAAGVRSVDVVADARDALEADPQRAAHVAALGAGQAGDAAGHADVGRPGAAVAAVVVVAGDVGRLPVPGVVEELGGDVPVAQVGRVELALNAADPGAAADDRRAVATARDGVARHRPGAVDRAAL